jgi:hypothetical protein
MFWILVKFTPLLHTPVRFRLIHYICATKPQTTVCLSSMLSRLLAKKKSCEKNSSTKSSWETANGKLHEKNFVWKCVPPGPPPLPLPHWTSVVGCPASPLEAAQPSLRGGSGLHARCSSPAWSAPIPLPPAPLAVASVGSNPTGDRFVA